MIKDPRHDLDLREMTLEIGFVAADVLNGDDRLAGLEADDPVLPGGRGTGGAGA